MITIHNVETNEVVVRDLTQQEQAELKARKEAAAAKAAAEAEAEAARQVLLDKLGITADEAKLLLGL
jgi:hypothetical protein